MALGFLGAGLWAQAPAAKAPAVKDQGEYDIYTAATKETDPAKKLDLLKQWEQKYPDSDFKGNRTLMQATAYQQIAMTAYGKPATDTAVIDAGNKAAKTLIDGLDTFFSAETKPAGATDEQWAGARKQIELQANTVYAYTLMTKKDYAAAEPAFKKLLQLDPEMAQASYWLGSVILAGRKVERMPEAIFDFARATVVTGNEALPAAGKKAAEDYLTKVYSGYHGDAKGLDDVKKAAAASPVMPADFTIKSIVDIQKEEEANGAKFAAEHPDLAFWNTVRDALKADGGDQYFATIKGAGIPPAESAGFKMFPAKVVAQNSPKELLVAVENPAGDATLQFDDALKGTIEQGTVIKFKGVLDAYAKDPYMLTFTGLGKDDVEGLPATAFAATPAKKPAAPAPKKAAPAAKKQ